MTGASAGRRLAVALGGVAVLAGGFFLGRSITTPESARLPPPEPVVVTAPVEQRALEVVVSLSGVLEGESSTPVYAPPRSDGSLALISATPLVEGDSIEHCRSVSFIAGRPLIALPGSVLSYRDLVLGDVGPDVEQLQRALTDCGFAVSVDGTFGPQTAEGVRQLYRSLGQQPPTVPIDPEPVSTASAATSTGAESTDTASPDASDPDPAPTPRQVPAALRSELLFLEHTGSVSQVAEVNSLIGDAPIFVVVSNDLSVEFGLTATQRGVLAEGDPITLTLGGSAVELALGPIPLVPVNDGNGTLIFPVSVPVPPEQAVGTTVGETVQATARSGGSTIYPAVVPVAALFGNPDGTVHVRVLTDGGDQMTVPVTQVAAAGGYVAIEGTISAGEQVVVGSSERG